MNKIYKVVWNKARNCYVVGSEFISSHSTGKTSTIGSKSLKTLLAVFAVCGVMYAGNSDVFAANAGNAQESHYVAIKAKESDPPTKTITDESNKTHKYYRTTVTYTDSDKISHTEYYYVREGFSVEMDQEKRHDQASTSNVLRVYKKSATADDKGLLRSNQIMIKDAMDDEQHTIATKTGNTLKDVSAGTYVGTSNGGGTQVPIGDRSDGGSRYQFYIYDNNQWVDANSEEKDKAHFAEVTADPDTGVYKFGNDVVSIDNLYSVTKKDGTSVVGVFVTSSGKLYTDKVFGANNEVLMTTKNKDDDKLYSYWAAETKDPDISIKDMTVGQLNGMFSTVKTDVRNVMGDTIDHIDAKLADKGDGGTISLMRRGQYNPTTKKYEGEYSVDGALKIASSGGSDGKDITIDVSQANAKGQYENKFSVNAGSKVEAVGATDATTDITGITINGNKYTFKTGKEYTAGDNIQIKDNIISADDTTLDPKLSTKTKTDEYTNKYDIKDTKNNTVTLEDVASGAKLKSVDEKVTTNIASITTNTTNIAALQGQVIKNGSIDNQGNISLKQVNGTDISVGKVHDYNIDSASYDSTNHTITLKNKDAYGDDNKDITIENIASMQDVQNSKVKVKQGDNVTVTPNEDKTEYTISVGPSLTDINSISHGDTKISLNNNGVKISGGLDVNNQKITNVANGTDPLDAVNFSQLQAVKNTVNSGWKLSVGNGTDISTIKPNSNVIFDTANGVTISKEETKDTEGNVTEAKVKVGLGDTIYVGGITIGQQPGGGANAEAGKYITGLDNKEWDQEKVVSGRAATEDQLRAVQNKITKEITTDIGNKTFGLTDDNGTEKVTNILGNTVQIKGASGITSTVKKGENNDSYLEISLDNNITVGKDGAAGSIGLVGPAGKDGLTTTTIKTEYGPAGVDGKDGITRIVYETNGNTHEVATIDDGLKFQGDREGVIAKKLNNILNIKGNIATDAELSDGNIGVINENGNLIVKLNKNLTGLESAHFGTTVIDTNGLTIGSGDSLLKFTTSEVSVGNQQIKNVANGTADTDAVNYGQLKQVQETVNSGWKLSTGKGTSTKVAPGATVNITGDNNITVSNTGTNVQIDLAKNLNGIESVKNGDSSITLDKEGTATINDTVTINKDGKISGVAAGKVEKGSTDAVNGSQLNDTNNRVTNVENKVNNIQKDITNIHTDITNINGRMDQIEKTAGAHSTVSTDKTDTNLSVTPTKNKETGAMDYKVSLNKELRLDSVTTGNTKMDINGIKVGENVSLTKDGLTVGDTKVTNDSLSIGDKTYVSKDGLNANNQKITNVTDGKVEKGSTDAVNGGQLYETNQAIANNATNISSLSHSLSNLDNRVNKVGAGAAALAALHPLDFDPDAKWDFAAGYGNYRGTNAAAVGAYYRPNEDTMFSVGGTFGNGENMVNAGVSFKLGAGSSHVSTSRVAMAKEIKELRSELETMKSAMLDANAGKKVDTSKLQLFPDVPQNHWAYEYVAKLAGNGMIEGYPDGNFAGDRPMTRYEFAAVLYRAMTKGAVLSDKILNEFSHELEYFTVDTVSKDKAGNPTIQRVRTVKANKNK